MQIDQYKTASELRKEIAALEKIALKGEITLPQARALARLKDELVQINAVTDPHRWART